MFPSEAGCEAVAVKLRNVLIGSNRATGGETSLNQRCVEYQEQQQRMAECFGSVCCVIIILRRHLVLILSLYSLIPLWNLKFKVSLISMSFFSKVCGLTREEKGG